MKVFPAWQHAHAVGMHKGPLVNLHELSERSGLPLAWLRREADAGRLPCLRAGRRRMFDMDAVVAALAKRQKTNNIKSKGQHADAP